MKKLRKPSFALLLAAVLAFSLLPVNVQADSTSDASPYIYVHDAAVPYWYRSPHRYGYTDSDGITREGYVPAMYRLISGGDEFPTYCCDLVTSVQEGTAYRRINLEDAGYYSADAAAHIRGILKNGYWVGGGNLEELGSLSGVTGLTAAEALSATQCAIWHFANTNNLSDIYVGTRTISDTDDIKDPVTVNVSEGGKTTLEEIGQTGDHIQAVYDFLIRQKDEAPASVIWSFEGEQVVLTAKNGLSTYDVTVKFQMKGSTENVAALNLSASLVNGAGTIAQKSFDVLSGSALTADGAGYYTVTFENVEDSALTGAKIQLKLSGTQTVRRDVYFYEPVGGRDTAQCFVGYGEGATPISSGASVDATKGTTALSLRKYDGSMSGNPPMPGVAFTLYVSIDGQSFVPYPGMEDRTTDENGEIQWEGLVNADNIRYAYKEAEAPDGYLAPGGTPVLFSSEDQAGVGNEHALGDLTIGKSVTGTATGRHFDFAVALDFSKAQLAETYTVGDIAAEYGTLEAEYTGTDGCGGTHPDTVSFTAEDGLYTAQISLAGGESVTLKGIPVGTEYTAAELDANGNRLSDGQIASFSGTLYVCPDAEQDGGIEIEKNQLRFFNVEYEPGSLILSGKKYLNGNLSQQKFSFTLTDITDTARPVLVETVENNENGAILFAPIRYEKAGTYSYEVRELPGGGSYEYDTAVYTVTVSVTQDTDANQLTAGAPVITKVGSAGNAEEIAFYNNQGGGDEESNYTSVTVKKVWKLGEDGEAADSVTVALLRNGVQNRTVVLSDENHWRHTWSGLDDSYTWTVKEIDVPEGFTESVSRSGRVFTVTNTYEEPETPDKPDQPDTPDNPGQPDDPGTPEQPDTPDTPSTPDTPEQPGLPQTGQLWWPVLLLTLCGGGLILARVIRRRGRFDENES